MTDKFENKNSGEDFLQAAISTLSSIPGAYMFAEVIVQNHLLWSHFGVAVRPTACSTGGGGFT